MRTSVSPVFHAMLFALVTGAMVALSPSAAAGPVHDAAKKGDVTAIAAALDQGADVNQSNGLATALYFAVRGGHVEAVRLLISRGADVNLPSLWGGAPLLAAASSANAELVSLLLQHGADIKAVFQSESALHMAARAGCLDCVKVLVAGGADVNALNVHREPPVHLAKLEGHAEVAQYLLNHGYVMPVAEPVSAKLKAADAHKGEILFKQHCQECHDSTRPMRIINAPPLWGVVSRAKASIPKFPYSQTLKEQSGSWTYDELNTFLSDPKRVLPGTAMGFPGLQDVNQRADLIAYLRTCSDEPSPLP